MKIALLSLLVVFVACNKTEFKENKVPVSTPMAESAAAPAGQAPAITPEQGQKGLPPGHPPIEEQQAASAGKVAPLPVGKVEKAAGGQTVEEVFGGKATLAGKKVTIRGKVVKFNAGIMGKNWVHIKDGTGAAGKDDLVVTTNDMAKVNDTVVVNGTANYDKDLGAGYFFPAIIEDANVKTEK